MKDFISGLIAMAMGIYVFFGSNEFANKGAGMDGDPAFYPKALAVIMMLLAAALLIKSFRKISTEKLQFDKSAMINVGKIAVAMIVYIFLLMFLGFVPATLIFTVAAIILFGGSKITALKFAIPLTGLVYVVFVVLFNMILPTGTLFN